LNPALAEVTLASLEGVGVENQSEQLVVDEHGRHGF